MKWLPIGTLSDERNKTSARALVRTGHPCLQGKDFVLHVYTGIPSKPHEELADLGRELDDSLTSGLKFSADHTCRWWLYTLKSGLVNSNPLCPGKGRSPFESQT